MVPLLENSNADWKKAVYSKFENAWSVATERYLYTEWKNKDGQATARMFYDHSNDPDENNNIVDEPEAQDLVAKHKDLLEEYYNNKLK
jgi:hypothetical protein